QQLYLSCKSFTTVTGRGYTAAPVRLGRWGWVASAFCFSWFLIAMAAPLAFLVLGSFMRRYGFFQLANPFTLNQWQNLFGDPVFSSSVRNSLVISVAVAVGVVLVYSRVAYSIVRVPSRAAPLTGPLVWVPWGAAGGLR